MLYPMKAIYEAVLGLHVLGGAVGLLTMLGPLVTRKGGGSHKRLGWVFCSAMVLSTFTGVLISASWITIPTLVKTLPTDPAQLERARDNLQSAGVFFGLLSLMSAHAITWGVLSTRNKRTPPWNHSFAKLLTALLSVFAIGSLWLGFTHFSLLLIGFGVLALNSVVDSIRSRHKTWLRLHIESMLGACTVATTAFSVQMTGRITTNTIATGFAWGLPAVLGVGASLWWTRRLRKRKIEPTR